MFVGNFSASTYVPTAPAAFVYTGSSGTYGTAIWRSSPGAGTHTIALTGAAGVGGAIARAFKDPSAGGSTTIPLSTLKLGRFVGGTAAFAYDSGVSYRAQVYADGLTLGAALYTGSAASTNSTGQLADITDAAFTAGTVYKVALTNQATGETTVTELTAI
jgi:hypothetical protein